MSALSWCESAKEAFANVVPIFNGHFAGTIWSHCRFFWMGLWGPPLFLFDMVSYGVGGIHYLTLRTLGASDNLHCDCVGMPILHSGVPYKSRVLICTHAVHWIRPKAAPG